MKVQSFTRTFVLLALCCAILVTFSLMTGCSGSNGAAGASAPTTGTVSGTVVTAVGSLPLSGVTVTTNPAVAGAGATTGVNGGYTLALPGGSYTISYSMSMYTTATVNVNVANGVQTPANATLAEAASGKPSVAVVASGNNVGYGQPFTVTATATSPLGLPLTYKWTGATGSGNTATATSQIFTSGTPYGGGAMDGVAAPSTDPGSYVSPYVMENRFGVLAINADTRGTKAVSVAVSDNEGGTTTASVSVNSAAVQAGVRQVAVGLPAFLNSGVPGDSTTTWSLSSVPGTSKLTSASIVTTGTTTRNPWFTPDVAGAYVVTTGTGSNITIYASNFTGALQTTSAAQAYTTKTINAGDPQWNGVWITVPTTGVSSVTYTNWPTLMISSTINSFNSNCTGCHTIGGGGLAPDEFTPWSGTAHATFFARGIENITSNSGSCVTCHTVGSDGVNVGNGGYDDAVAATGFQYKKYVGAWGALTSSTALASVTAVANIQCENCHGAQTTSEGNANTGHGTAGLNGGSPAAARVTYSSDDCAVCHSSGTHHHNYSEWIASINPDTNKGHSKLGQLNVVGYSGHARATNSSCSRCHTAQGFADYTDQLSSGNAGTIPPADITWDLTNAEPQTCIACHDPHDATNPNQLRVYNTIPVTMSGVAVDGLGKGAICIACHNIRNGLQCASAPTTTGLCPNGNVDSSGYASPALSSSTFLHEDPDTYAPQILDTPHDNASGDVLMGRNAFFMQSNGVLLPMLSKHANVEDSCVGCHMALNPQTHGGAASGHVFYISDAEVPALCANCHSSNVNGEALQTSVEDSLTTLGNLLASHLVSNVTGTIYVTWTNASKQTVITGVDSSTLVAGTNVTWAGDGNFLFSGIDPTNAKAGLSKITTDSAGTTPVFAPNSIMRRAIWNEMLIDNDQSKGIHNPSFVTQVLNNTINELNTNTKTP